MQRAEKEWSVHRKELEGNAEMLSAMGWRIAGVTKLPVRLPRRPATVHALLISSAGKP